jgi:hypothetical protein
MTQSEMLMIARRRNGISLAIDGKPKINIGTSNVD